MTEIKFFGEGRQSIDAFLERQYPSMSGALRTQLMDFIPNINRYHEEGAKLRPTILFCNDINKCVKAVKDSFSLQVFEEKDESTFRLKMKALAPFSRHGWNIYVEKKPESVRYGIIKALNSVKDKTYEQLLFNESNLVGSDNEIVFVKGLGASTVSLKSIKEEELVIEFSLSKTAEAGDRDASLDLFVTDAFSKLRTTKAKLACVKTLFKNVFQKAYRSIDGAICVVVDKDYKDNGFFEDGIWLKNPIEFSKLFLKAGSYSESKLLEMTNLFIDMLNFDGITIIDNVGRVRAYNVFVESTNARSSTILGGARKRAAYTIMNTKRKRIVGVYFQSHDGELFYNRVKGYVEKPKKVKKPVEPEPVKVEKEEIKEITPPIEKKEEKAE
ncbi:MAG: hypothetical protein J6C90_03280 [Clostridia bacterium]|nr:hypothetical protein [Clostridia bacterium]